MATVNNRYNLFRGIPVTKILSELLADDLLPSILFRSSRKQCDEDIDRLKSSKIGEIERAHREQIEQEVAAVIAKYGIEENVILQHPHYSALVCTAAGAHHAGQLLQWRLVLEELMSRGLLRLMIATGTVAAGVDFPARSVIVTAHSRRGNDGFVDFTPSEFQQMAGRAGRRGKDTVGVCIVSPGQFSDARTIHALSHRPPDPLRSAYFAAPATVLNLLKFRSVDDLRYTVERSLASFYDKREAKELRKEAEEIQEKLQEKDDIPPKEEKKIEKRVRRKVREAERRELRQEIQLEYSLSGLTALGYLDERGLTEKGLWSAELCTSLVLHLAEAIEEGIFYERSEDDLATLVGSIAGDAHRTYYSLSPNPISKKDYDELQQIVDRVQDTYHGPTTASDIHVLPDGGLTVHAWLHAEDWGAFSSLLKLCGVAEGDAARVITQTADHLHQLSRLKETHPELARTAYEARSLLLRPPLSDSLIQ
ncbi:hypothetical protein MRY87_10900 [bacterium]|nr:hypothetical protein [bacterium]